MTLQETKEKFAKQHSFESWSDMLQYAIDYNYVESTLDTVARLFAIEIAKAQREACAQRFDNQTAHAYALITRSTPLVTDQINHDTTRTN